MHFLSDCLDEIGPDQIICVGASPIPPLPVPRLRFRLRTPVENPHCYSMLCRLLSIFDSVSQSPCRFRGRRLVVQSIFIDLFMSPVSHFRIPRFSHFSLWQLATGNWRRRPRTVQWKRRRGGEQQAREPGGRTADRKVIQAQHAHHTQHEA
jgi:hypothetical protein